MQVKLRLKSIEPVGSDQGLAFTCMASSQEVGELELKTLSTAWRSPPIFMTL
jgi:hypothetical protein